MELGSSRQWLRVVQSKIVHLNLEVAVRVFESLQESSADTSNFCSSETFKSFLNISARVSYLTGEYHRQSPVQKHGFWLFLSHHLEVIWFQDIVHPDIPKYLMTVTGLNRRPLKLVLRHCDLTLNSLHFAAHFN